MGAWLIAGLLMQGPSEEVGRLVQEGSFDDALSLAASVPGEEGHLLKTWTRHQAGDLRGALVAARSGLEEYPNDPWLLEQASWLSTSLLRGDEAVTYSGALVAIGHPGAEELRAEAVEVFERAEEMKSASSLAAVIVGAVLLVYIALARYGMCGDTDSH